MAFRLFGILLALALPQAVFAADPADGTVDYSLESWDERQGLPSGRIWAIAQDSAGYLWLGTENGLVRFDGVRFTRWAGVGEEAVVFAVSSARDGSLWVGLAEGGVVRIVGERVERYGKSAGIGDGPVQFLFEDREGVLWAGDRSGVYRFAGDRWERLDPGSGLPPGSALDAHEDQDGNLWISTNRGIYRKDPGRLPFRQTSATRPLDFSEDSTGIIWITDPGHGFSRIDGSGRAEPGPSGSGAVIVHDRHATMWVGTQGQGLWRIRHSDADPGIQQITVAEGLSSNVVRSILEDRDGNVWVGTESALHRFTRRNARSLTDIGFTWATQRAGGNQLWIATSNGLVEVSGSQRRRYGIEDGLPSAFVRALTTDLHGQLWVATDRGLARRRDDGRFETLPIEERFPSIISIAADSRGRLWICDRQRGAFLWSEGRITPVAPPVGISGGVAQFVLVDRQDRVWVGYPGLDVSVQTPAGSVSVHHLGSSIGSVVTSAYEARDGAIWIGGIRGLGRVLGETVATISEPDVLPGYGVFSITEDAQGSLWLGISSGVLSLSVSDFERAARDSRSGLRYRFFDASDGIAGVPVRVAFPAAASLDDDTLWFTTSRGMTVLSPRDMDRNQSSPVVRIEAAQANDRSIPLEPEAALLPGTSSLRITFTAPNLTSPMKERFRYRLVGVDDQWIDAGVRREAFYANLRSGSYRFEVGRLASEPAPDGSLAAWAFSIRPRFYETWWFISVCLLLTAMLAWLAWQMRLRQLRRQFALVFAERARMSREIHDTVVQELLGISLHFDELAASLGATSKPFEGQISRLKRYLEVAIVEAREVVWELRSPSVEESNLPRRIREAGERAFARKPVSLEFVMTGTPRQADAATERHLFRIAQEALSNASRYAQATHVVVTLAYREDTIRLEIRDTGRGLPFSEHEPELLGHYGFSIMRERAEQMGGQFRFESAPNQGTRIEVDVPAPPL